MKDASCPALITPAGPPVPGGARLPDPSLTPAGLQPRRVLARRRAIVIVLNLLSFAGLTAGVAAVFGTGGWSTADVVILATFLLGAPWTVMGFWNAVLGLWLLHGARDGLVRAAPHLAPGAAGAWPGDATGRIALMMFLRNEPPERAFARLLALHDSLRATGEIHRFDTFVLSDTSDPEIAAREEALHADHAGALGGAVYRRRAVNTGYKAGNIRDFLETRGQGYRYVLPLDSDSLMSGPAVLELARVMDAHPRLGILQSLVIGTPSASAFARIFQFGMRHGMRSFTMGAAWWQGDCGPYWGHNALIRTAPFLAHCALPVLPGRGPLSGHVLSHDQVEAVLMRRAGYEVRVLPVEGESWEDNPVTLPDFTRRDLRWCQGNMQYWRLLGLPGLERVSRFQLFAAMMMYFGAPAWMLMTLAAASKIIWRDAGGIDFALGLSMFMIMFAVSLFPKIAGWIDTALTPGALRGYGGGLRFAAGALTETLFSMMLAPVVAFRVTLFLLGLPFGRAVIWGGQMRDPRRLSWGEALAGLWPQTLFGLGFAALVAAMAPSALPWTLPVLAGLVLAVPFAVVTASGAAGRACQRLGLCALPEERRAVPLLAALEAPLVKQGKNPPIAAE
ncbi:glucans biosynthesis glucosyltransferase MdoH [Paroceanicella profunda]|uniref:Glucans biosynthesis glucosyltransferase H n=1 Tax=Paroceanicella profunda TaxID=2579971 RepID=A0A5B8FIA5_9RHOB|nr:glucans biosynthesis glucosyltransferase MdoH [Paroceanicella profunda]QDL93027.1 glucans biosynthesis glucosyltransferase MdoH [Paroceanicella profunda]